MPMDFPDMASLRRAAQVHGFRPPTEDEPEVAYREALADHVQSIDFLESMEIRTGHGWNQFTEKEALDMLRRSGSRNL